MWNKSLINETKDCESEELRKDIAEMETRSNNFCGSFQNDNENCILPLKFAVWETASAWRLWQKSKNS